MSQEQAQTALEQATLALTQDPILQKMLDEEKVESKLLDGALLSRLFGFMRPHWSLAAVSVCLALVESFVATGPAWLVGVAMDRVSGGTRQDGGLVVWLDGLAQGFAQGLGAGMPRAEAVVVFYGLTVALLWSVSWMIAVVTTYLMNKLGQVVVHDLRVTLFRHITGMDLGYFHKNPVGRLVNRTTFDVQSVSELFSDAFANGVRDLLSILVLMVVMLGLDLPLGLALIFSFPCLVFISYLYRVYARPALRANSAVQSRMNSWMAENLSGMRENQLYRAEDRRRAEYKGLTDAFQLSVTSVIRAWAWLRPAMLLVTAVSTVLVLWMGYSRVTGGLITVGVLLTFLQYTANLWRPVRNLTEKFNLIQQALTSAERIMDVLDKKPALVDLETARGSLGVHRGAIRFRDVTFRYPGTQEDVLRKVGFEVPAGQMLALVGDTGAGKSTVAHLISRFYDTTEGVVEVDGEDVRDYTLGRLRSGIALVPQDVVIFAGSVRENITLGAQVEDARLWECIRAVRAEGIVARLGGLDQALDEGGRTLSVGERQLLSFARALVANPPILILDEATANVDTQTELLIQDALEALTAGRTCVAIAHRLSTIRHAHLILVLRRGQVVERGDHESLMALGGEYAQLVRLHLGGTPAA